MPEFSGFSKCLVIIGFFFIWLDIGLSQSRSNHQGANAKNLGTISSSYISHSKKSVYHQVDTVTHLSVLEMDGVKYSGFANQFIIKSDLQNLKELGNKQKLKSVIFERLYMTGNSLFPWMRTILETVSSHKDLIYKVYTQQGTLVESYILESCIPTQISIEEDPALGGFYEHIEIIAQSIKVIK